MKKAVVSTLALLLLLRCTYAALQAQHRHHHNKHHEAYRGGELVYQADVYKKPNRLEHPLMKQHKYDDDQAAATTIIRPLSHHVSPSSNPELLLAKPSQDTLPKETSSKYLLSRPTSGEDDNDNDYRGPQAPLPHHKSPSPSSSLSAQSSDDEGLPPIGPLTPDSNQWAIVYYPYTASSSCKPASTIRSDIASISAHGFTAIRLHASDCNALQIVGSAALLHGMRMIVGIHIDDDGIDETAHAQVDELIGWATSFQLSSSSSSSSSSKNRNSSSSTTTTTADQPRKNGWDLIELLTIGEETVYNGYTTPHALATFIDGTRHLLRRAGYRGPITTTEPIPTLYQHREILCPALDIPASNIHPFFVDDVAAGSAGDYVAHALSVLEDICADGIGSGPRHGLGTATAAAVGGWPSITSSSSSSSPSSSSEIGEEGNNNVSTTKSLLRAINLETGWPHKGIPNGRARPGTVEQMVAIHGIMQAAGRKSVVLGWGDDAWKDEGEWGVETGWGCERLFAGDAR